jgi:hypothetical protein
MKIKHKQSGAELTVKEEQAPFKAYWTTDGGSYIHKDDPEWELVKEEEWEDVTSECKHIDRHSSVTLLGGKRFRYSDGLHNGPAFIVERRKA